MFVCESERAENRKATYCQGGPPTQEEEKDLTLGVEWVPLAK